MNNNGETDNYEIKILIWFTSIKYKNGILLSTMWVQYLNHVSNLLMSGCHKWWGYPDDAATTTTATTTATATATITTTATTTTTITMSVCPILGWGAIPGEWFLGAHCPGRLCLPDTWHMQTYSLATPAAPIGPSGHRTHPTRRPVPMGRDWF